MAEDIRIQIKELLKFKDGFCLMMNFPYELIILVKRFPVRSSYVFNSHAHIDTRNGVFARKHYKGLGIIKKHIVKYATNT